MPGVLVGGVRRDFVYNEYTGARRNKLARIYPKSSVLLWQGFVGAVLYLMHAAYDIFAIRPQGHVPCDAAQGPNNSYKFRTRDCLNWPPYVTC